MFLLSENPWQEDNFQSYGEIESNIRFEFYGGTIVADKIQNAYHDSKNIYDGVLTQGNIFSKLYIKLFWSGTDDNEIARKVLSYIPNDFDGELLDVPVGTAQYLQKQNGKHLQMRRLPVLIIARICLHRLKLVWQNVNIFHLSKAMLGTYLWKMKLMIL